MRSTQRGRPPLPTKRKRKKVAPYLAAEAIEQLAEIKAQTGESQGEILDRLIAREHKKMFGAK